LNEFWVVQATVTRQNGEIKGITLSLGQAQKADEQIMQQNQRILRSIEVLQEYSLTKRGRAGVCQGGEDEEYIMINTRGPADMYRNFQQAQVTVKDQTVVLKIKGTVRGSPVGPMLLLSKLAARNLGVRGEVGGVIIQPVESK
jgi:hypothetical protein